MREWESLLARWVFGVFLPIPSHTMKHQVHLNVARVTGHVWRSVQNLLSPPQLGLVRKSA